jgi:hypothetical protein
MPIPISLLPASVLQTKNIDDHDKSITMLSELREKTDSSVRGDPSNDLITNEQDLKKIVLMIDNLIDVLELKK